MEDSIQIKELTIDQLNDFIKNSRHDFKTTHTRLCFKVIQRIHRRVCEGYRFGEICIYNDEVIIDGNHRYIAYRLAGVEIDKRKYTKSHSDIFREINNIVIDEIEDWDYNSIKNRKYCSDDFLKDEYKA